MGKIYSGPLQELILEDSQNGSFSIKELLEGDYSEEQVQIDLADDNKIEISRLYKVEIRIANTDAATLAELKKRTSLKQTLRVLWMEIQVRMQNVYIQLGLGRNYKPGVAHEIVVKASTSVDSDVSQSNIYANPNGLTAFYDPYTQAGN